LQRDPVIWENWGSSNIGFTVYQLVLPLWFFGSLVLALVETMVEVLKREHTNLIDLDILLAFFDFCIRTSAPMILSFSCLGSG
jgi:hypothetical protein